MSKKQLHDITDKRFEDEVDKSPVPVVINFWAPWCEPCKLVDPILAAVAAKYGDRVRFYRMNIDDEQKRPDEYAVRSIPTLLFFKNGAVANQIIGVPSEAQIAAAIEKLL